VTVDEELNRLEDNIRRLKIEYEIYFNGASPRPPQDTLWHVETAIKRLSLESPNLNFGQRFRFNQLVQHYMVNRELWRKKLKEKEEGRGRFAVPRREAEGEEAKVKAVAVRVVCTDPDKEPEKVDRLLRAMIEAKRQVGERVDGIDPLAFEKFVRAKARQIKESLGCDKIAFSVSVEEGKVRLKARKSE